MLRLRVARGCIRAVPLDRKVGHHVTNLLILRNHQNWQESLCSEASCLQLAERRAGIERGAVEKIRLWKAETR